MQLCGRVHYHETRKNLESRRQLDEPAECTSGGNPVRLYTILHLQSFHLVQILCVQHLESRKIINLVLMRDLWNFSFFGRGDVSPTHSGLCHFVLGSQAKHQVSSLTIVLLKKSFVCIGHRDTVLVRCDSIFPLLRCQGVWNETCTQLSLSQILFQNLKNYSLWNVQKILLSLLMRFNGHF